MEIQLLGDSHISGFDNRFWLPNLSSRNLGVSGRQVDELIPTLPHLEKSECVVQVGTNDILKLVAAGIPDQQVVALLQSRCRQLVDSLDQRFAHAYIFEILPPAEGYFPGRSIGSIYEAVNQYLRAIAATSSHCTILPVTRLLNQTSYCIADRFTNDKLHLNHNGYEVFSQIIYAYAR